MSGNSWRWGTAYLDLYHGGFQLRDVACYDYDMSAFLCQLHCNAFPHSLRGSREEHHLCWSQFGELSIVVDTDTYLSLHLKLILAEEPHYIRQEDRGAEDSTRNCPKLHIRSHVETGKLLVSRGRGAGREILWLTH